MEDRLQKFAHLIEAGSFTRAARDLHISQPALSMSIQKLERELQAVLYIRGSHPLTPTHAGQVVCRAAKELGTTVRTMQAALSDLSQQEMALSIGMIDSIADILLAKNHAIRMLESHTKVSLAINNSRYLLQALIRGEIDVAIIAEQAKLTAMANFANEYIGTEPLLVVCHERQVATTMAELAAHELMSFISYDQPSHTHAIIKDFFANQQIDLAPRFFSSSPDVIYRLLMAGKGAAALPYRKISRQLHTGKLIPICAQPIISRRILLVTRRNYYIPDILQSTMQELGADLAQLEYNAQAYSTL